MVVVDRYWFLLLWVMMMLVAIGGMGVGEI